ncbi:DNA-processing protein DprA [Caldinitratiruptor microaerophilus]|uniref:DNA processing protein DprA n=1 Tax=Caldinitratiruptor microaerophilus TaxID=671077 RepID=A0AA35CHX8_9FIRM|nr:DNA-processing protein DprA [Caldinitratiruptor microaerophilus]BDG59340.1 DNA processing protein DprA [Caldinitratiruptor microaerophilus]
MDRSAHWVALASLLGRAELRSLLRAVPDGEEAFRLVARRIPPEQRERALAAAQAGVRRVAGMGGRIVLSTDPEYPESLRRIDDPPPLLYCAGPLPLGSSPAVAVVGTRHPSSYGLQVARRMGADLASVGVTVVSGLAMGVDSAAHRGALEAGGPTVAVLGTGLDVPYPRSSERLYREIRERGLLVSEFPPGAPALPWNFPQRNRIISGLSAGVVVVEAGERSGTEWTVRWAQKQGKEVLAVPGPVTSRLSVGPHRLLLEGAPMVTCAGDVLQALGLIDVRRAGRQEPAPASGRNPPASAPAPPPEAGLARDEARVLRAVGTGSLDPDGLSEASGLPVERVLAALGLLELKGLVRRCPDGTFHRVEPAGRG